MKQKLKELEEEAVKLRSTQVWSIIKHRGTLAGPSGSPALLCCQWLP